jgi:hypothetical protein
MLYLKYLKTRVGGQGTGVATSGSHRIDILGDQNMESLSFAIANFLDSLHLTFLPVVLRETATIDRVGTSTIYIKRVKDGGVITCRNDWMLKGM